MIDPSPSHPPATSPRARYAVLAVDDEASILEWLARSLERFGYDVRKAPDLAAAQAILQSSRVDALIVDVRLAGGSGLDVLEYVRSQEAIAATPVIVLTGLTRLDPDEEDLIRRHQGFVFYKLEGIAPIVAKLDQLLRE